MMARPSFLGGGPALTQGHSSQGGAGVRHRRSSILSLADPDRIAEAQRTALRRTDATATAASRSVVGSGAAAGSGADGEGDSEHGDGNSNNSGGSTDSDSDSSSSDDSEGSDGDSAHTGDGEEPDSDGSGSGDDSGDGSGDLDLSPHRSGGGDGSAGDTAAGRCSMRGCGHTAQARPAVGKLTVAKERAARERQATEWSKHGNSAHLGQHEQFLRVHAGQSWCKRLTHCDSCNILLKRHSLAQHNDSAAHRKRMAARAAAQMAEAAAQQAQYVQPPVVEPLAPATGPEAYTWTLAAGSERRAALDALSPDTILGHQFTAFKRSTKAWVGPFATALQYVLRNLRATTEAAQAAIDEHGPDDGAACALQGESSAWAKLLQLTPCMLLAPDGSDKRMSRFGAFAQGSWVGMLRRTLSYTDKQAQRPRKPRGLADVRRLAADLARKPGGIGRLSAAFQRGDETSSPRTESTLQALRKKHPAGPADDDLRRTAAEGHQTSQQAVAASGATSVTDSKTFTAETMRAAIRASNQGSAAGLSALSVCHLQQVLKYADKDLGAEILDSLVWLGNTIFDKPDILPAAFWSFFRAARLSAVGVKCRPIACGATLRRLLCKVYALSKRSELAALFEPVGQYGVAVAAGVERMGVIAQIIHEAGGVLIAVDGRNAFNAISRTEVLRQAARHIPEAYALVAKLYGDAERPALMYGLDGAAEAVMVESAQGVQQGDPLGPVLFALVLLPVMRDFKQHFPELTLPGFLDDLTVGSLAGSLATDLRQARVGYDWLVPRLKAVGIEVNTDKTECLLPQGASASLTAAQLGTSTLQQYVSRELGGIKVVAEAGMVLVGAPVGSAEYSAAAVERTLRSAAADSLLREVARLRDPQVALALLRLCYHSRATFLCRNARPSVTGPELQRFDGAVMVALAAIMQEPGACTDSGLQADGGPDVFGACLSAVRDLGLSEDELPVVFTAAQKALVRLPHHAGGFGLASMHMRRHAAFVARTAGALQSVLAALGPGQRERVMVSIFALPTVIELRTSLQQLCTSGVPLDRLRALVPGQLVTWSSTSSMDAVAGVREWLRSAPPAERGQRAQSALSAAMDKHAAQQYVQQLRGIEQQEERLRSLARYLSMSGHGAAAFLATLPSASPHLSMSPPAYRESMRRWLDVELPDPGGLCSNASCDHAQTARHAARCSRTGEQNYRHNPLCDMFADVLRTRCKLKHVMREDSQYFVDAGFPDYRLDVTWQDGQMRMPQWDKQGRLLRPQNPDRQMNGGLIDVTVVDQTGIDVEAASHTAGVAAMRKAMEKHSKYEGKFPPNYTLIPIALEQSGRSCPNTGRFVRAAAEHESEACSGAYSVSACIARWRQRISIVLQRSISESVLRLFRKTRADPASGGPPIVGGHLSVSLLVVPGVPLAELAVEGVG